MPTEEQMRSAMQNMQDVLREMRGLIATALDEDAAAPTSFPDLIAPAAPATATVSPAPAPSMATLRSQAEFFMGGVVPTEPQIGACSICTDTLNSDVVRILSCGHSFHLVCVLSWFESDASRRGSCPNCRLELYEPAPLRAELPSFDVDFGESFQHGSTPTGQEMESEDRFLESLRALIRYLRSLYAARSAMADASLARLRAEAARIRSELDDEDPFISDDEDFSDYPSETTRRAMPHGDRQSSSSRRPGTFNRPQRQSHIGLPNSDRPGPRRPATVNRPRRAAFDPYSDQTNGWHSSEGPTLSRRGAISLASMCRNAPVPASPASAVSDFDPLWDATRPASLNNHNPLAMAPPDVSMQFYTQPRSPRPRLPPILGLDSTSPDIRLPRIGTIPLVNSRSPVYEPPSPGYSPNLPLSASQSPDLVHFGSARDVRVRTPPVYRPTGPHHYPSSPDYDPSYPGYDPTSPRFGPTSPTVGATSPYYSPISPEIRPISPTYHAANSPSYQPAVPMDESWFHDQPLTLAAAVPRDRPLWDLDEMDEMD